MGHALPLEVAANPKYAAAFDMVYSADGTAWTAFTATWVGALVGTLISWATTAGTDDGLITSLARRARKTVLAPKSAPRRGASR